MLLVRYGYRCVLQCDGLALGLLRVVFLYLFRLLVICYA